MSNPFLEKAQKRKERQRQIMGTHVRELEKIHNGLEEGETKERIRKRLEQAREDARKVD